MTKNSARTLGNVHLPEALAFKADETVNWSVVDISEIVLRVLLKAGKR